MLCRPKFCKYILESRRQEFLAALVRQAEFIHVTEIITACRDSKDNKFLELAVSGKAVQIISGDNDLLVLNPFRGIVIASPADFLATTIS